MRSHIIKALVQKEIRYIFRDKKTIFMMIILPILLYPILMVGSISVGNLISMGDQELIYRVGMSNDTPKELRDMVEADPKLTVVQVANYKGAIGDEKIQAYIRFEEPADYYVYYDGSQNHSNSAEKLVDEIITKYKEGLIKERIEAEGFGADTFLNPINYTNENIAEDEEMAGFLLSTLLPFILLIIIAQSALYPAIDAMAGEKERGTLETLLTLPISNLELVMGKYIAVSIISLMTTFLHIISLIASVLLVIVGAQIAVEDMGTGGLGIDLSNFVFPITLALITVLIFTLVVSAISMSICSFAKSFKEAQNYLTPLQLLVMIPSYAVMIPTLELNPTTALIPIMNTALLIKSIFLFEIDLGLIGTVLGVNIILAMLSIYVLIKLFDSEDILFGSGKEFSLLQKRYNIKKGTMPTSEDAYLVFALAFLVLVYVGQLLQISFGFVGIALTQVALVSIALAGAWYIKTDWKKVFSIKRPTFRQVIASIILWVGAYLMINVIAYLTIPTSPENQAVAKELAEKLFHHNIWLNLLVIAVFPAVCEELLFRGIIYKGIEEGTNSRRAILISSFLFGLMHMDFIRIIPTGLIGVLTAYIVYKTGSIFLAMLVHFINNGTVVIIGRYGEFLEGIMPNIEMPIWGYFFMGLAIAGIGVVCFGKVEQDILEGQTIGE